MLIVDGANVVGSRPTGWWRDRAGAARALHAELVEAVAAGRLSPPVLLVLEGRARAGVPVGEADGVQTVHAGADGDAEIVARAAAGAVVVTADRALRELVRARGADVVGPNWLLDQLG